VKYLAITLRMMAKNVPATSEDFNGCRHE